MEHNSTPTAHYHSLRLAALDERTTSHEIKEKSMETNSNTIFGRLLFALSKIANREVPENSRNIVPSTEAPKLLDPSFAKQENCSSKLLRVTEFLCLNPGAETKLASWSCQVADIGSLLRRPSNRKILEGWGLEPHCERKMSIDGFGESWRTGHWSLLLVDEDLFEQFLSRVSTK